MTTDLLTLADLRRLARPAGDSVSACPTCAALVCPGWESVPGGFERKNLQRLGTLRDPGVEDPTLAEHHPAGTHGWSPDAPIAPAWFPYNRCDVWQCVDCARTFLRYTEYGGYYQEERIRELRAQHIVDAPL